MPTPPRYRTVDAKTITRVPGSVDPWFLGRYGMNLYRGCEHGCLYCDGRAERYHVAGDFARDIVVKRNALAVLARELDRIREPGFVFIGGGVCDAYQPAEGHFELARGALALALQRALPVHVLTKAALVERDLELLARVDERSRAILSFSIQTTDDTVRETFEPGAAPLSERWRLIAEARRRGLTTGVMAMPVLPGISDQPAAIDALVARAAAEGVDFVLMGGLTLRPGIQQQTYLAAIRERYPEHLDGYARLYAAARPSGAPDPRYTRRLEERFRAALSRHGLPARVPPRVFCDLIPRYAEAAVRLEHLEHELDGRGRGALRRAGDALQRWARQRFAAHRSRRFGWRDVERELAARVADGSILDLDGIVPAALPLIREVVQRPPPAC